MPRLCGAFLFIGFTQTFQSADLAPEKRIPCNVGALYAGIQARGRAPHRRWSEPSHGDQEPRSGFADAVQLG